VLASSIDSSALVGYAAAEKYLAFDGHPSTIYVRAQNGQVNAVDNLLANTANPEAATQPSDAIPRDQPGRSISSAVPLPPTPTYPIPLWGIIEATGR
jgi:hypothetical protein